MSLSFCWCPQCHYWVPAENMVYDVGEEEFDELTGDSYQHVTRVCTACLHEAGLLNGPGFVRQEFNYQPPGTLTLDKLKQLPVSTDATKSPSSNVVVNANPSKKQCVYCDSTNVYLIGPGRFRCLNCREEFVI